MRAETKFAVVAITLAIPIYFIFAEGVAIDGRASFPRQLTDANVDRASDVELAILHERMPVTAEASSQVADSVDGIITHCNGLDRLGVQQFASSNAVLALDADQKKRLGEYVAFRLSTDYVPDELKLVRAELERRCLATGVLPPAKAAMLAQELGERLVVVNAIADDIEQQLPGAARREWAKSPPVIGQRNVLPGSSTGGRVLGGETLASGFYSRVQSVFVFGEAYDFAFNPANDHELRPALLALDSELKAISDLKMRAHQ